MKFDTNDIRKTHNYKRNNLEYDTEEEKKEHPKEQWVENWI